MYLDSMRDVTQILRPQYSSFVWRVECFPVPPADRFAGRLVLGMSFAGLRDYEERFYNGHFPSCFVVSRERFNYGSGGSGSGPDRNDPAPGCYKGPGLMAGWRENGVPFWSNPPESWYLLVKMLRRLAGNHGM